MHSMHSSENPPPEHPGDDKQQSDPPVAESNHAATAEAGGNGPPPADSAPDALHANAPPRPPRRPNAKSQSKTNSAVGHGAGNAREADAIAARLIARLSLPAAALDPKLLPRELLDPLDRAGLASPDCFAGAAMTALAMVGAVAGPLVTLAPPSVDISERIGRSTGLGLRVCLLVENRDLPVVPRAVTGAAHAVQNVLLAQHRTALALSQVERRIAAERCALHAQAVRAAAALGHAPPPPLPDGDCDGPGSPPRIVVDDGASAAVIRAADGGTGVLLIDERRMPTFARTGHGDPQTATLLNAAALGHPLATPAADTGQVTMRTVPIAVVGVLTRAECETLLTATREALVGTAFVAACPPPPGADAEGLADLARRVHAITTRGPAVLALSGGATSALVTAAERWNAGVDRRLQPLGACVEQLPDLAKRLAFSLHLVAATAEGKLVAEIGTATARRAVAIIDDLLLPAARTLLGAVSSTSPVEADALRLVAALRRHTSTEDPVIEKRDWQRATHTTTPLPQFKAAVRLLLRLALVAPAPPPADRKGGESFAAAPAVHAEP
jgi:hypothetical protein